ncbi:GPI mannosyltransferase 4 isoform X2 [Daktulosphaira vitifoliae]|uniref:GPI mannosyltransferase 4 isoform X2 n=1 Tax=Daktulosphaira vitifoliae TaxID=58002 RepID=UPI0021AA901C|nr:GPI mannosyltransferase 4 isoform X2 [Daktulosphaira vitifoliae]
MTTPQRICKICKLKPDKYLILLSSSYVLIVYGTRTFTNSIELALLSLLLWLVIDSMKISEKVIAAEYDIRKLHINSSLIQDRVIMSRKLKKLPHHSFIHCLEISFILVFGTFNRPTFLIFAITPIFFWLTRGLSKDLKYFIMTFNLRFLVLIICAAPITFIIIVIDSFYFGHVSQNYINFIITPLNFIKYNMNSSNLAEHGIHFRLTHCIINMPLLFNVMTALLIRNLSLNSVIKNLVKRQYHLLPSIYQVNTLMVINIIIPIILLSVFPHQEPRFLIPILLPVVFTASKFFCISNIKYLKPLFGTWCIANAIGLLFYGHLHQAGVTPMISQLALDIRNSSNVHIIHGYTYSIPLGLFLVPQQQNKLYKSQNQIRLHDLGSSLDITKITDSMLYIKENITYGKTHKPDLYLVLSGSLSKKFEYVCHTLDLKFTKVLFFPHLSIESLSYYKTFITDLTVHDDREFINRAQDLYELFSLVLFKIT